MPAHEPGRRALTGLLVVAVANGVPALFAAGLLADHGARVILVEDPAGCPVRRAGRSMPGRSSYLFESEARGTESVVADLTTPAGRELAERVLHHADVLLEDLGPGRLEALGLGPAVLATRRPRLSVVRISPYGQVGPLAGVAGDDRTAQAFSGCAFGTGFPDGLPQPHRFPMADYWTGLSAANGAILAVIEAIRSGLGQVVDLAVYETLFRFQEEMLVQYEQLDRLRPRMGNEYAESAPANVFPAADGRWVVCAAANNKTFRSLCTAMGTPELADDPRYVDGTARVANRVELNATISAWSRTLDSPELVRVLNAAGAPATLIRSFAELVEDPQVVARRNITTITDPAGEHAVSVPNVVPRLERTPGRIAGLAPRLGEHTAAVTAEFDRPAPEPTGVPAPRPRCLPLAGVRVLDLGRFIAAPVTASLLAEFGAEIIRVELPGGAALTRSRLPLKDDVSLSNLMYQRGKHAMTLDIRTPEGRDILLDLVARSDVVVENFRPGTLEGYGLGLEALRAVNERIILVRLSGWGQDGPRARQSAFDPVAIAAGGGMSLLGGGGTSTPLRPGPLFGDYSAAIMAYFGALLALCSRLLDGHGQQVELGLYEPVMRMLGDVPARFAAGGELREETAAPWTGTGPWHVAPASDGRYVLISGDGADHDAWIGERPAAEAVTALRAGGVVCSLVMSAADLVCDPHVAARDNVIRRMHHRLGWVTQQGVVPRLTATPGRVTTAEVPYGMHTNEILGDLLGYPEHRVRELTDRHVI